MALAFNIFLHALLIVSMLGFLAALLTVAARTSDVGERLRRSLALFVGAMVVVGAQAGGVSFAVFTTGSLAHARGASTAAHIAGTIVPALAGVGLGYYFVRVYKRNETFGLRMLCFVGMLALVSFAEVYASATHTSGVFLNADALPNLSFVVGVALVFVFTDTSKASDGVAKSLLRAWTNRHNGTHPAPNPDAPNPASNVRAPRDPFAR